MLARSPMACTHTWKPRLAASRVMRSTSSGGTSTSPLFAGSSQYGAWSAAPREPSAPSSQSLTAPTVRRPSPIDSGAPRSRYAPQAFLPLNAANTRSGKRPRPMSRVYDATAARSSPGSCTPVRPLALHSAMTASTAWSKRSSDGGGTSERIRSCARSIRSPVGSPRSSFSIRPPSGSEVWRVMPARASAALLAQVACPSTRTSATGWPGAARSSETRVGKRCPGHRDWSQPRPAIHSPVEAPPPRRRPSPRSPPPSGRGEAQLEAGPGEEHQVTVSVHEPRQHGAPAQVERRLARGRIDVAAPPGERHAPSRITSESTTDARGVHRVDAPVGQEHGAGTAWASASSRRARGPCRQPSGRQGIRWRVRRSGSRSGSAGSYRPFRARAPPSSPAACRRRSPRSTSS